eukprot:IDg1270t1
MSHLTHLQEAVLQYIFIRQRQLLSTASNACNRFLKFKLLAVIIGAVLPPNMSPQGYCVFEPLQTKCTDYDVMCRVTAAPIHLTFMGFEKFCSTRDNGWVAWDCGIVDLHKFKKCN